MQNQSTSARTTAKYGSKNSLLFRQAPILAILMLCAVYCQAQNKNNTKKNGVTLGKLEITSGSLTDSNGLYKNMYSGVQFIIQPSLIPCDTVKCYFLEIADTATTTTKWTKGFVVRKEEMVAFGKTKVSSAYLPITSGIVTSELFYEDRKNVVNQCLQVVLVK